jgi:hypothetical protein
MPIKTDEYIPPEVDCLKTGCLKWLLQTPKYRRLPVR